MGEQWSRGASGDGAILNAHECLGRLVGLTILPILTSRMHQSTRRWLGQRGVVHYGALMSLLLPPSPREQQPAAASSSQQLDEWTKAASTAYQCAVWRSRL
jgi:hypothetical protein